MLADIGITGQLVFVIILMKNTNLHLFFFKKRNNLV